MNPKVPDGLCLRCGRWRKLTLRGHCTSCRVTLQRNGGYAQEEEDIRHDYAAGFTIAQIVANYPHLSELTVRSITC